MPTLSLAPHLLAPGCCSCEPSFLYPSRGLSPWEWIGRSQFSAASCCETPHKALCHRSTRKCFHHRFFPRTPLLSWVHRHPVKTAEKKISPRQCNIDCTYMHTHTLSLFVKSLFLFFPYKALSLILHSPHSFTHSTVCSCAPVTISKQKGGV